MKRGQCDALLYPYRSKVGYYCVLPDGHWGGHKTDSGIRFSEEEATYLGKTGVPVKTPTKGAAP